MPSVLVMRMFFIRVCLARSMMNSDVASIVAFDIDEKKVMEQLRDEANKRQVVRKILPLNNKSIRLAVNLYCKNPIEAGVIYGDIRDWVTGGVTDMSMLFWFAPNFNEDISLWDTHNVRNMNIMFNGAVEFDQDIGGWNVGAVTNMKCMFNRATAFDQDIGGWNVGAVTDMRFMFNGATAFDQDIGGWQVGAVTYMRCMFLGAAAFDPVTNAPWYKGH